MALNKRSYLVGIILISIIASGCQHQFIVNSAISVQALEFNEEIPQSFRVKSYKYFAINPASNGPLFTITKLTFKKKNFFGGPAVRSQEIEVLGELEYRIETPSGMNTQSVSVSAQLPSNEANPQGEMVALTQLKDELEFLLLETLTMEHQLVES